MPKPPLVLKWLKVTLSKVAWQAVLLEIHLYLGTELYLGISPTLIHTEFIYWEYYCAIGQPYRRVYTQASKVATENTIKTNSTNSKAMLKQKVSYLDKEAITHTKFAQMKLMQIESMLKWFV